MASQWQLVQMPIRREQGLVAAFAYDCSIGTGMEVLVAPVFEALFL